MKHNNIVKQITIAGVLTGLGVLVGAFAKFPLLGSNVYLVGAVVFLMPLVLRLDLSLIAAAGTIAITDLLSSWIATTYISISAYLASVLLLWLVNKIKILSWLLVPVMLVIAGVLTTGIFFVLEYYTFDEAFAYKDIIVNAIQFAIVVPITILLYAPFKLIGKYN